MKIELLNQFRATIDLKEYGKESYVYRTHLSLEELKDNLPPVDDLAKESAEWTYEGSKLFVYARTLNAQGDIHLVNSFFKKGSDLGGWAYYTIHELKELHKLDYNIYVKGYGDADDFETFEQVYKDAVIKK